MYSFATPPIKLKLGQQIGGGQTTWTNHYDGPIRNTEQQLDHNYYTLFLQVHSAAAAACTSHGNLIQLCSAKTIFLSQTDIC